MANNKVLVAMSGGVDSAVTAFLLKRQGYDCIGVTMRLWGNERTEDAKAICHRLEIPFAVADKREDFNRLVVEPFVETYLKGSTPNPCILCNRHLKFGALWEVAEEWGADLLATGHYARITEENGVFRLKKAKDPAKDQSYVLYNLTAEQLSRVRFPLGDYTKQEVRAIAEEQGFQNAKSGDSQDICFIPDGDHAGFIRTRVKEDFSPGEFVDLTGRVMGMHKGIVHYTVGQRKGLGLALPEPYYVCKKDAESNRVVLCTAKELPVDSLLVEEFHWIQGTPETSVSATVRTRYHQKEMPATLIPREHGVEIRFDTPAAVAAPGQSAVVYDGDVVLGGGEISPK
ncbi:MAG: tRNA 2-thiouridine(34) synthase MnmA [Clostridia bacterium]|nr:tRNA 2-thiouridine(34) synthase MnmA [Clostridia bacterium]